MCPPFRVSETAGRIALKFGTWLMAMDPLARRFTEVDDGVQQHVRTPFPYLGNDWRDDAEIWCVVMEPTMRFIGITNGAHSMCALSCLSNR